jgi:tetratricopeptide (TPR) repeat protein
MKKIVFIFLLLQTKFSFSQTLSELINKGDSCLKIKEISLALQYYSRAIERDTKCSICYYKRGSLYEQEGYYSQAIEDLKYVSLLRIASKDSILEHSFYRLGICYSELGQHPKAVEFLSNALLINAKNPGYYKARFISYLRLQRYESAYMDIKNFQQVSTEKAEVYALFGMYFSSLDNSKKAVKYYTKAILTNPSRTDYYVNRGVELAKQTNYDDAILNFSKAIELDQNNDEALLQRGITYHKINNILAGCSDFRKASNLGNDEARVMLEAHCPH